MEKHGGEVERVELKYDRLTQRMRQVATAVVLYSQFYPDFNWEDQTCSILLLECVPWQQRYLHKVLPRKCQN